MDSGKIHANGLSVVNLSKRFGLESFDCGDEDLNEFLKRDSFSHEDKGIARTYVCLQENHAIGFFSACADAIRLSVEEARSEFGKPKTYRDYPAVKIARLAVSKKHQNRGIGSFLVKLVVGKAVELSKSIGCRFVTVDAYPKQAGFYKKLGFVENLEDASGENVSMRFDLFEAIAPRED
ncbi:MAG: GNAT family N-acetyltransferase [Candidatus Micrarchaeota archaeon]